MTTDQYTALKGWIAEQEPGQTADELHAALHTPSVPKRKSYFVTYRTIGAHLQGENAHVRLEAIAATIASMLPMIHGMLSQYGGNTGQQGGVDMALDSARGFMQSMVGEGDSQFRQAEVDAICALADTFITPATDLEVQPTLLDVIRVQREVQS